MKLGIVGKGGVGKTTVAALFARAYRDRGARVLAIDTDSNPNLGVSLGLDLAETEAVPTLPRALVVGRGGADTTVQSLIGSYGRSTPSGVTLLTAMRVDQAGAGCTCGAHATVRSLLGEAIDEQADVTVIDMEAGLEHLSRSGGTLAYADVLLVVMEPSRKSVITAARTATLAEELGIPRVYGLGNKARSVEDLDFLRGASAEQGLALAGILPYTPEVVEADRAGEGVATAPPAALRQEIDRVMELLDLAVVEGVPG
ncbi:MAG TPA: AAA family ATPase [Nitriliruptorales bacterium]|nr:AAA family ATPase [Nitriliruptorales bacterium]